MSKNTKQKWKFWIDRGGTFTDIIAVSPNGTVQTSKLLSECPESYEDAAVQGIRDFLNLEKDESIPEELIAEIKMGTTVATNALLERKGEPTVLAITSGLNDILKIGYQARPDIFALNIEKPSQLYEASIELDERMNAKGEILSPLDETITEQNLRQAYDQGYRSLAIVLMHAYLNPDHELKVKKIAEKIGFTQISTSHEISPLIKIVSRGDTTVVDAYLTPVLRSYVDRVSRAVSQNPDYAPHLFFMKSSGGLTSANAFQGRDAILSGPAGGIVAAAATSQDAGFSKMIGFDMGGTSTDVSHFAGTYERTMETEVAGVRMRAPMLEIHTVAAGGGSILQFDGARFRVGPESAGASPGPASYRRGGPLTVTDINVALGKINPDYFPAIFGINQNEKLDKDIVLKMFSEIAGQTNNTKSVEEIAEGFLEIAIEHMAQAIKKISIERGHDIQNHVLNCFGGAGGQHACLVAEKLGIRKVLLHPYASVLSAYGMGLADLTVQKQQSIEKILNRENTGHTLTQIQPLIDKASTELQSQGVHKEQQKTTLTAYIKYENSDTTIPVPFNDYDTIKSRFEQEHKKQFGFIDPDREIVIETLDIEVSGGNTTPAQNSENNNLTDKVLQASEFYSQGKWQSCNIYHRNNITTEQTITGPAVIVEDGGTNIIEPGWTAKMLPDRELVLEHTDKTDSNKSIGLSADPVLLEIFNKRFMSIAEQMGVVLKNTASSVNIKERLDFSCAIFDPEANLVANAPHVPVHLGSMDASIKAVIKSGLTISPGDVFVHNNPYDGGTHLPDITVVTPVFDKDDKQLLFYVASRGHHADVGGISPGSMSPNATSIDEEGIIINCQKLVAEGIFLESEIRSVFSEHKYPARNIDKNIADLKAQIAANAKGVAELIELTEYYSIEGVHAYMKHIQDNAELSVRNALKKLEGGQFTLATDSGAKICVSITIDREIGSATIDFSGTSEQQPDNFNAPSAVTQAAVLYVFRCLVQDDIPLNAGCLKPLEIIIPEKSMLNPSYPAAVVAGNVEVSQSVTNALFGALEVLGSSQATMNNLTFGNEKYQYYETICSGAPAGPGFNGADAVHTHMTNSRLTDPEVLESRFPVLLKEFSIVPDSGGTGKWKAGNGVKRSIQFLEDMECALLTGNRLIAPFGTKGGNPGKIGRNWITKKDGKETALPGNIQITLNAGDTINIQTPTGGGFGKTSEDNHE